MDREFSVLPELLLSGMLERALSRYLTRNPEGRGILAQMAGKVIAVQAPPLIATIYLLPAPDGIRLQTELSGTPDVTLSGTPLALATLGARGVRRRDLFSGEIEMTGDTAVAEQLATLFQVSEPQWRHALGALTPPMLIDRLADWTQAVQYWGTDTLRGLEQDLAEFLREESRDAPSDSEVHEFLSSVDRLRDDCERLEVRIERLGNLLAGDRPRSD